MIILEWGLVNMFRVMHITLMKIGVAFAVFQQVFIMSLVLVLIWLLKGFLWSFAMVEKSTNREIVFIL